MSDEKINELVEEIVKDDCFRVVLPPLDHRPGCIYGDRTGYVHRVPIDCLTIEGVDDLFDERELLRRQLEKVVREKDAEILALKGRLFDYIDKEN